jgi:hypothetical protein
MASQRGALIQIKIQQAPLPAALVPRSTLTFPLAPNDDGPQQELPQAL